MNYKDYATANPEIIDLKEGYTEYLVSKFRNISRYLTHELPFREDKLQFEEENSILLEDMAVLMEEFIHNLENR